MTTQKTPNDFRGTDSERIEQALAQLPASGGTLVIPPRQDADGRDWWLLDRAILLADHTTLLLDNATLKLSDRCRDNAIRSANCGLGITDVRPMSGIHVLGRGDARIVGADRPRATGDSAKQLGARSFGTDAGKDGESQYGDWRNIMLLLANVSHFSVSGITFIDSHCWTLSCERCAYGRLTGLSFFSEGSRLIDGQRVPSLNQDGIDLRLGCHDILIDSILGSTGDDVIALTGCVGQTEAGQLKTTMVTGSRLWGDDDIRNVTIRNVVATSRCQIIRFLNNGGCRLHHIILDNVIDSSPEGHQAIVTVRIGDNNPAWGGVTPLGDTYALTLTNIQSRARDCILVAGSLADSVIANVLNFNPDCPTIRCASGDDFMRNVTIR